MSLTASFANLFDTAPGNRVLAVGIAVSILAHAMILVLFPGMRQSAPASSGPSIITATLSNRIAAPPPKAVEEPRPRQPEPPKPQVKPPPEAPKQVLTRPDSSPSPAAPRIAEPPPAQAPPVSTAPSAPSSPPPAPSASATAPRAPEAPAPGPSSVPRPTEAADAGNLDQYRIALLGAANRYKRYPAIAMEKGWSGKVEVRMVIGTNGMTQSISIKTSSGFEILDKTALEMVTKAKPVTPIPPALRGREFSVDIPVIFTLQTG